MVVLGTPGGQKAELPRRCFETVCSDIGILKNALGRRHGYILLLKCSLKPLPYKFSIKKVLFRFLPHSPIPVFTSSVSEFFLWCYLDLEPL